MISNGPRMNNAKGKRSNGSLNENRTGYIRILTLWGTAVIFLDHSHIRICSLLVWY